ncbi:DNA-directed DNA polymerase II small subunit [Candidatus Nitrosocosmicus franklandus]|uniref:DNA polymerase II small subunit n=1 Tax=Candidatus Nitrosocosmicus franklandianus TaxID=1798806 RepID=A0A484IGC7_9ARCH|nr:DNA-directed DNA polymerase II small subunit [Candidatus Nitrosocosmicus franklandus]VFJ14016.1 DNA polymerase II small subunit [Candidatus Nitrosocosmicus franklandus]
MTIDLNLSKIISFIISRGFQIHPDALVLIENMEGEMIQIVEEILSTKKERKEPKIISSEDIRRALGLKHITLTENDEVNRYSTLVNHSNSDRHYNIEKASEKTALEIITHDSSDFKNHYNNNVVYDSNYSINSGEGVQGYISLFRSRFDKSLKILSNRPDGKRIKRIGTIKQSFNQSRNNSNSNLQSKEKNEGSLFVAGLVMEKKLKKSSYNIIIDDQTGLLEIAAYNDDLKKQISLLTLDQMIMIELENNTKKKNYVMKNLYSLDVPDRISNRAHSEIYAVLISDLHIGSKFFMENEFQMFLNWLNSTGEHKDIVSKIKYICICGDLIDGIGIFPHQDKELLEKDSFSQMEHATKLLSRIPKHMKVFLIPGNHDLGRRALPQPAIPKKYADKIYSLSNITMLGNPCMIDMEGVRTLMFHGQSLDDTIATIPGLSYSKPAEAMKILLKARHLSPIYGQRTPIAPEVEDMMVIEEVPDIFHSGHVHVIDVDSYKGTLVVNSGAWQTQTPFQRAMGITPTPGIAIVVNLSTLKPYQINFANF